MLKPEEATLPIESIASLEQSHTSNYFHVPYHRHVAMLVYRYLFCGCHLSNSQLIVLTTPLPISKFNRVLSQVY